MNDHQEEKENNIGGLNLAYFSPSVDDIVRLFNAVMKIIKGHAGKRDKIDNDSFESNIKEKECTLKVSNFPDKCPHCNTEESLELDNALWGYDGEFLGIPVICGNCNKRSKTIYRIEFEQTEGRD